MQNNIQIDAQPPRLRIVDVSMFYPNEPRPALDNVSIEISAGEIHGILGPNGSGKTTLSKVACGLLSPSKGKVYIDGESNWKTIRHKSKIGLVLGGDRGFYARATVQENMLFFADLLGIKGKERQHRVQQSLELTNLSAAKNKKIFELSKGMKQRLHISRATLGDPSFLILDEPTSGLDPEVALQIRTTILDIAKRGAAIMLTTHYLTEAEYLASKVSLFKKGKMIKSGKLDEFLKKDNQINITKFSSDVSQEIIEQWISASGLEFLRIESWVQDSRYQYSITWMSTPDRRKLLEFENKNNLNQFLDFETKEPSLEEIYLSNFNESSLS
jgi:ABC-2 type transport system ATP-binding protein